MLSSALIAAFVALSIVMAPAASGQSQLTIPPPTGVVNDFAHVLDAATIARITRIAEDVRAKSRGEIAVVTMSDIGDRDPADVAMQIGRQWKVGKIGNPGDPTRNAGAVILLVPKETSKDGRGHCFIATGRGAEGFITDATAGDICREATPAFAQKDYATGTRAGNAQNGSAIRERIQLPDRYGARSTRASDLSCEARQGNTAVRIPAHFLRDHLDPAGGRQESSAPKGKKSGCNGCIWPLIIVDAFEAADRVADGAVAEDLAVEAAAVSEVSAAAVDSAVVVGVPVGGD